MIIAKNYTLKFSLLIALILSSFFSYSQDDEISKSEKVEQLKIAFFTKELDLSPDEAEQFWPIYNEMSDKLRQEKLKQRKLARSIKENQSGMSESDFKQKSSEIMDSQIQEAKLKSEYHHKIAGVIGYKKATKLLSLEQRFKRELLNRVNKGQQKPGGGRPGGPRNN